MEISLYSPFCDLIKDLYQRFGHDQEQMKVQSKPISSALVQELHAHAQHLLKTWHEDDLVQQKQLLVALSCIINTIDEDNAAYYEKFAEHKNSCVVEGFMTPSQRQLDFVDRMLQETNFRQTLDLECLDIWSLRHACDLRVSLKQESPFFQLSNSEAMKEELTICSVVHILIGELSSNAVRCDRRRVEGAISRDRTSIQARGRKIDLFFQLEEKKPVELFCWEAKTADATSTQLQVQRRKNLRLNACLIGTTHSLSGLDRETAYPLPSPLLLDIAGRTALPYKIHKIDPDVFVAGAVVEDKNLICMPRTKEDMVEFLEEGGMSALLNIKLINDEYAATVKQAMRKVKKEEAKNKMLGYNFLGEKRNPIINTPVKRYKVATRRIIPRKSPLKSSLKSK
ncbi:hypothetical protein EC968_008557 [Mortierella alpina]|nr:hypothetical protein EC968_008557 [Mortierella alpina]